MTTRIPISTIINEGESTDLTVEIPPNNNDTITVNDPALAEPGGVKYKLPDTPSIYSTEINDRLNQKIIQVTSFLPLNPAGNIGEIQYNGGGDFSADSNFKWDFENNLLFVGGNINVGNTVTTHIEANSNISINVGSADSYKFTTDGKFKTPYYYFPYDVGVNGQTLVSDGMGGLFWDSVNTPFARISSITGAIGVVVHNVVNGFNFSHTNIAGNFSVNVVGLTALTTDKTITITLILTQSNPAYLPTGFQIDGVPIAVNWSDNQPPVGYVDKKEIIVYNIFNENSVYKVYGHYTSYAPAI